MASLVGGATVFRLMKAGLMIAAAAAAVAMSGASPARAATLTETFTFDPIAGYGFETGSAFSAFDSALGTLNSVTYDVVANATFAGGGDMDFNEALYALTFVGVDGETPVLTNQMMTAVSIGDGAAQASLTSTDSNLTTFLAPGLITSNVTVLNEGAAAAGVTSTFPTESVTYNYTPAAPVPEPPSFALLASGLAGLGWMLKRRAPLLKPVRP